MTAALQRLLRVSVAVRDLDAGVRSYGLLGLHPVGEVKESQRGFGLRWVELGSGGEPFVELLAPTGAEGPLARFLDKHGEGLYQVRLGTDDIGDALDTFESRGVRVVRDTRRPEGHRPLGWVHPASTHGVLVELVEPRKGE